MREEGTGSDIGRKLRNVSDELEQIRIHAELERVN